jgi:predicted dehydrogenase
MDAGRRKFLKNYSSAAAALAAAPLLVPRTTWGANDRLTYGVIGTGRRGQYVSEFFHKLGAQCVALCDVYDLNLEAARKDAPGARTYLDYRDLVAHKGLDCVLIATPDHQHYPCLLAALNAGKDVYLEKPVSMSLEQSARTVAAVRKTRQIVQVGTQRRSAPLYQSAKKLLDQGMLGRIRMVKATLNSLPFTQLDNSPLPGKLDWERFLGPAPRRPLEPRRFRWWRVFWDYSGGTMTDNGCHLMDVVQWLCNSGPPRSAVCQGRVVAIAGAETPDVLSVVFEYPEFPATLTFNMTNTYQGLLFEFQGDQGTLVLDGAGFRVYKEPWSAKENREPIHSESGGVPMDAHVRNFLDCIKSRQEPVCPIEEGVAGVAGLHLANVAFREGRRAKLAEFAQPK